MEKEAVAGLAGDGTDQDRHELFKEEVNLVLEKICQNRKFWLYSLFFLAASPGILNGMHISAYVFYVDAEPYHCKIPELEKAGWTNEQIRNISLPEGQSVLDYSCEYYDLDYAKIATQSYESISKWVNSTKKDLKKIPCKKFVFESKYSVISEWHLVCDRFVYRSNIQAAFAIGKIFGASFFGIISDRYGRRLGFTMAALTYVTSALLAPFTGVYYIFLFTRFLVGASGVGYFGTVFTLLTEIVVGPSKAWMCCAFNASYPVGISLLSLVAYHLRHWQSLQIFMAIPTLALPFYYWIIPESPQWLVYKRRYDEAWKVLRNIDRTLEPTSKTQNMVSKNANANDEDEHIPLIKRLVLPLAKFASLFSTWTLTKRALISFFSWFTVATTYYGLTMNGQNFDVGRYMYPLLSGIIEILSNIAPIPMLGVVGRKTCSILLFITTGISLLSIMFLPRNFSTAILIIALLGRFCDSAVYAILPLYTAELFPTTVRNTAVGASVTMSHLGTLVSPYIVDLLGAYIWYIPSTIFGSMCIFAIFLLALLPETRNKASYNTVEEMERAEKTKLKLTEKRSVS